MGLNFSTRWALPLVVVLLSLLQGCVSKIPHSLPLSENEKTLVLDQLKEFQDRRCRGSIDIDVTFEWEMFGKTERMPGLLQLQAPSFIRYSVVDPIGRQLLILVSDGKTFSLVDNNKAKALTGHVNSHFWNKYIPKFISSEDQMSWLTGRLPAEGFAVKDVRGGKESVGSVWLITRWENSMRHHVLFYPELSRIGRHLVEAMGQEVLLDVTYLEYTSEDHNCSVPQLILVEGSEVSGKVQVHLDKIFPEKNIPLSNFHLTLPEHFTEKAVD